VPIGSGSSELFTKKVIPATAIMPKHKCLTESYRRESLNINTDQANVYAVSKLGGQA